MNRKIKPVLGYGFRVFISNENNINKLQDLINNFNLTHKQNIILNKNKFVNNYGQYRFFVGIDKLENIYKKSLKNDEIVSTEDNLNISIDNNEKGILFNLHKQVNNLGLIIEDNFSWNMYNFYNEK